MKIIPSSRKNRDIAVAIIFLAVIALNVWLVSWLPAPSYDLTIASTAGGSIITPGEAAPYTYDEGTVVNLVAEAEDGYRFVNWTGDVSTITDVNAAATNITMYDSYSITANFELPGVTFPDPDLETAIREALNKPSEPIYASDLAELASLQASSIGIENLAGLQYCTNLTYLKLWSNQISDISPLANLTNLTNLDLHSNRISDISPLANLTNLTNLDLYSNQVSDISPLVNLTNLTYLNLNSNQISDISPLVNLTNLTYLQLYSNQVSDISPLANLTNLTDLRLVNNQISDIGPLMEHAGLSEGHLFVALEGNPLSSDSINIYIPQLRARGVTVDY